MVGRGITWVFGAALALGIGSQPLAQAQVGSRELREPDDPIDYSSVYSRMIRAGGVNVLIGEQSLDDIKATVSVSGDGGATWEIQKGLAERRLMGGFMYDAQNGIAVGEAGTALTTSDGGATWELRTTKAATDLQDAFFLTADKGWAVGANSTVVGTTNGGRSWSVLQGGVPSGQVGEGEVMFMGVHFFDDRNGVAAGAGIEGSIQKTKDGGKTWETVFPYEDNFSDLVFADDQHGWAVGKYGLITATTDGGGTWEVMGSPTEEDLWAVAAGGPQTVWISGDQGVVGYSKDGGASWTLVGLQLTVFGTTKDLTKPMRGLVADGSKAWAMTEWGRVYYLELQ